MSATPEQQRAIDAAPSRVVVTAAAGSGKTRVLVARYLEEIARAGYDVRKVVAITFTRKAAAEMRERIRKEIAPQIVADANWRWVWNQLHLARIETIDGFCRSLLAEHALEAGLDPDFAVVDERESTELAAEVLEDFLVSLDAWPEGREPQDERHERVLAAYRRVLRHFSRYDLKKVLGTWLGPLRPLVLAWAPKAAAREPDEKGPRERLWAEAAAALEEEFAREYRHACVLVARSVLKGEGPPQFAEALTRLREELEKADSPPGPYEQRLLRGVEALVNAKDEDAVLSALAGLAEPLGVKRTKRPDDCTALSHRGFQQITGLLVDLVPRPRTEEFEEILGSLAEVDRDGLLRAESEVEHDLAVLFLEWVDRLETRKREPARVDFADLQSRTLELLRKSPAVLERLQTEIHALLVDEAQDTGPWQWEILRLLCPEDERVGPRLFVVGDEKQSIYRFRGADVARFASVTDHYERAERRRQLSSNFRSRPGLLDFFHRVFSVLFPERREFAFEARYEEMKPPEPTPEFPEVPEGGRVDWVIVRGEDAAEVARQEARAVARILREYKDDASFNVWARKNGRLTHEPFDWKHAAILFQRSKNMAVFEEALREAGIPYQVYKGREFYRQPEVRDLVALLRCLADPSADVALLAVLRSPLFAISDPGLFWITSHRLRPDASAESGRRPARTLSEQLAAAASAVRDGRRDGEEQNPPPDWIDAGERERIALAREALERWMALAGRLPLAELLGRALLESGFWVKASLDPRGPQVVANVEKLLDQLREAEGAGFESLWEIAERWWSLIEEAESESEGVIDDVGVTGNAVSLMTVHASKGLEFPLVVLPELAAGFPSETTPQRFAERWRLGLEGNAEDVVLGLKYRARGTAEGIDTPLWKLFRFLDAREKSAEKARLFYVACTRARDGLVLVSGLKKDDSLAETWHRWTELAMGRPGEPVDLNGGGRFRLRIESGEPTEVLPPAPIEWPEPLPADADTAEARAVAAQLRPIAEPTPRITLFPSSVGLYEFCPLKYRYSLVLGIPEHRLFSAGESLDPETIAADPALRGQLVHRLIERAGQGAADEALDRELRGLVAQRLAGGEEADAIDSLIESVHEHVAHYRQSEPARLVGKSGEVWYERPIRWYRRLDSGAEVVLSGQIDLLFRHPDTGRLTVVDFKTNRAVKGKTRAELAGEEGYDRQVRLYAMVVGELSGESAVDAALFFTAEGVLVDVPTPAAAIEAERERLLALAERLRQGAFPPTDEESRCRACGYRYSGICRKWAGSGDEDAGETPAAAR